MSYYKEEEMFGSRNEGLWVFFSFPDADADMVLVGSVAPLYKVIVSAVESIQANLVAALTPNSAARGPPQPQP